MAYINSDDSLVDAIVLIGNTNDYNSEDMIQCGDPVSEVLAQPGHWVTVSCDVPILGR